MWKKKWRKKKVVSHRARILSFCFFFLAPVHGHWGRWSEWQPCSKTCNDGQIKRYRRCNNPKPQHGGRQCPGSGEEAKMCIVKRCHLGKWPEIHWYIRNHDHDSAAKLRLIHGVRASQNSWMAWNKESKIAKRRLNDKTPDPSSGNKEKHIIGSYTE